MTETLTGTDRSAGISYEELLDADSRTDRVPAHLRAASPMPAGDMRVPAAVYHSRAFHDLEVELLWKKVWQLACHEDELRGVGDYVVYDIADLSYLIVRTGEGADDISAYRNACLHRGRKLRECDGHGAKVLRCAFHGWSWRLDGSLNEIPCQWDFPTVEADDYGLPQAQVGRYGGFVFINPDPEAAPLADFLGSFPDTQTTLPMENRYVAVHVAKVMPVNWKACQEAFMEAYHVVATHPTLMETMGDANSRYDVFENYSRAISPNSTRSPHLANKPAYEPWPDGKQFCRYRHPMSGFIYERADYDVVHVIDNDGNVSVFNSDGVWVSGPITQADPHLCLWIGGPQVPGFETVPVSINQPDDGTPWREYSADMRREELRRTLSAHHGVDPDDICDAELVDAIYYSVFPNWSPWGCFNAINYRFRPNGNDPDSCIFEVMLMAPSPEADRRPDPAKVVHLGVDDDWTEALVLGPLAKIFQQDSLNLPWVQRGVRNIESGQVVFANYAESKIRDFHVHLQAQLGIDYAEMMAGVPVEIRL
jgi:phenylpropionate dioxygenase-like ring-hydroxylating dioxygenase large terminal subunit